LNLRRVHKADDHDCEMFCGMALRAVFQLPQST